MNLSQFLPQSVFSRFAPYMASAALVGAIASLVSPHAAGQVAANHSAVWTGGEIIYIDLASGSDLTRDPAQSGTPQYSPGHGSWTLRYRTVQHAVQDVLTFSPSFPVVFNIMGTGVVHQVSNLSLPAYGVKLQPYIGGSVTLDGGGMNAPVLRVDTEGQRTLPDNGVTPATIIQGLTITRGSVGVQLSVALSDQANGPLRTEVRGCTITDNKFGSSITVGGQTYGGGMGIFIDSFGDAPTQYVIESNLIFDQADFFPGWASNGGPSSWGIRIQARPDARDSTLIRGNQLLQQETGIGLYGHPPTNAWVRPRILSNFLAEHEQHFWSVGDCGPVLINNTLFRTRDYCEGPDRHIVYHNATPIPMGADPFNERTAMIVRNCIFDYDPIVPLPLGAVRPYDPIVGIPGNVPWPIANFGGGGTVDVAWSDVEILFGPLTAPSNTPADLRLGPGNFLNRAIPFASIATPPDLHLTAILGAPPAPMIEGGDLMSTLPGLAIAFDGQFLPCDVRTDVDGDARACDFDRNGSLLPDRGADEVLDILVPAGGTQSDAVLFLNSGLRLTSSADANGNVANGANVQFTIAGRPNEAVVLIGWLDCPTDNNDDVVFNHLFLPPVGNVLLPLCGQVTSATMVLDAQGLASMSLPLSSGPEFQAYFQAVGLSAAGAPATGYASNRIRIELN